MRGLVWLGAEEAAVGESRMDREGGCWRVGEAGAWEVVAGVGRLMDWWLAVSPLVVAEVDEAWAWIILRC